MCTMERVAEDTNVMFACVVEEDKCEVQGVSIYEEESVSAHGLVLCLLIKLLDPCSADLAISVTLF